MASQSPILSLLRQAAPRLSRHFFNIGSCPNQTIGRAASRLASTTTSTSSRRIRNSPFLQAFKNRSASTLSSEGASSQIQKSILKDVQNSAKAIKNLTQTQGAARFPETSSKAVGYWLFASAIGVFGIVVFGGLTRLTESGLSITEWRPVTGSLPPMSDLAWDSEFDKYKASPEFRLLNPNMSLEEFKKIYWMEWGHRLWGRAIGLTFLLPSIYFIARKQVSANMARNLVLINLGIISQGVVGWWMVKSGLKDDLFAQGSHPRVSQYRLATHLALAFTVYTAMLWNGLTIFREHHLLHKTQANRAPKLLDRLASRTLLPFRVSVAITTALIAITAFSGAFVAGLDAGLIYNEWPYMGNGFSPPASELLNPFYSRQPATSVEGTPRTQTDLLWRNMFENPSLVQFDHRMLAYTSFTAVNALWAYARFSPAVRAALTKGTRSALNVALGFVYVQVALGLTTLLYLVPTPIAASHQAGSLALLTSMVILGRRARTSPRIMKMVQSRLAGVRVLQKRAVQQAQRASQASQTGTS